MKGIRHASAQRTLDRFERHFGKDILTIHHQRGFKTCRNTLHEAVWINRPAIQTYGSQERHRLVDLAKLSQALLCECLCKHNAHIQVAAGNGTTVTITAYNIHTAQTRREYDPVNSD